MSEEKVLTLRGKRAVWAPGGGSGPIDPKLLPEGYPYKEQSETVLLAEQDIDCTIAQGGVYANSVPHFDIAEGNEYTVLWNGETYLCKAYGANLGAGVTGTFLGNVEIMGVPNENANGEPFLIGNGSGTPTITGVYANTSGVHTVGVSVTTETIHPMAPEFLPALTSPNGTKYQLTVADDGTLSAVAVS